MQIEKALWRTPLQDPIVELMCGQQSATIRGSRDEWRNEVWEYLPAVNVRTVERIIQMPSSSHNPVVNRL